MEEVPRGDRVRRVGLRRGSCSPGVLRAGQARPEERDPEVELHHGVPWVEPGKAVQTIDRSFRPARERLPDTCLDGVESSERLRRPRSLPVGVQARRAAQGDCLLVVADTELERQRRRPFPCLGRGSSAIDRIGLQADDPHDDGDGHGGSAAVSATTRANGDTAAR